MGLTDFFLAALLGFGTIFFFGRPFALTADRRVVTAFADDFLLTTFFVVFFVVFFLAPGFVGLAGFADFFPTGAFFLTGAFLVTGAFFLTGAFLVTFAGFFGFDLAVRRVVAAGRRVPFTGFGDFDFLGFDLAVDALALAFDAIGLDFVALALERAATTFFFLASGFFLAAVAIVPPHHSLCATSLDAPKSPMPNGPHLSRTGIPLQPVTSQPVDRPGEGKNSEHGAFLINPLYRRRT